MEFELKLTDCIRVGLDSGRAILELNELVTHEYPRLQVVRIEFERTLKIVNCLVVFVLQTVVVADDATTLGSVLVDLARLLG